jgi:hypothetical protein
LLLRGDGVGVDQQGAKGEEGGQAFHARVS